MATRTPSTLQILSRAWFIVPLATGIAFCAKGNPEETSELSGAGRIPTPSPVQIGPIAVPLPGSEKNKIAPGFEGRCEVQPDTNSNIAVPCHNIEIELVDSSGKTLEVTRAQRGHFSFSTPIAKGFSIKSRSKKYQIRMPNRLDETKKKWRIVLTGQH